MAKRRKNPYQCPRCGTIVEAPEKTWQLVAPLPDKQGRITITVMGSFRCPKCGYRWRAVISKLKVGEGALELESARGRSVSLGSRTQEEKAARREGKVIELDLSELEEE